MPDWTRLPIAFEWFFADDQYRADGNRLVVDQRNLVNLPAPSGV